MHQAAFSIVCGPLLTFAACKVDVLKNTPFGGDFFRPDTLQIFGIISLQYF